MRILGIDPGYGTIGYGIIDYERGKMIHVEHGAITTQPNSAVLERLKLIETGITDLINKVKPDEIAIEELFFNTNITTGIKVAQARGVILLAACKLCESIFEYTPLQIKSTLTGNGVAKKQQIQFMVKSQLNLKDTPKPDDAADALAAAMCHALSNSQIKRSINRS